jgi:hypothetical protein
MSGLAMTRTQNKLGSSKLETTLHHKQNHIALTTIETKYNIQSHPQTNLVGPKLCCKDLHGKSKMFPQKRCKETFSYVIFFAHGWPNVVVD